MDIEKLLQEKGVSLYRLSKDIGVAYSTAHKWKKGGKISPAYKKLLSMYFVKNS